MCEWTMIKWRNEKVNLVLKERWADCRKKECVYSVIIYVCIVCDVFFAQLFSLFSMFKIIVVKREKERNKEKKLKKR